MEPIDRYQYSLKQFELALKGLIVSLKQSSNFNHYDADLIDVIKSGQIQKFEYTAELAWKTAKKFVEWKVGEPCNYSKDAYKIMLTKNWVSETVYLQLVDGIDDRNKLSHIYKESTFDAIYLKLEQHTNALNILLKTLQINS